MFFTQVSKDLVELQIVNNKEWPEFLKALPAHQKTYLEKSEYKIGKYNIATLFHTDGNLQGYVLGLDEKEADPRNLLRTLANASQVLPKKQNYKIKNSLLKDELELCYLGWGMGKYKFQKFLKKQAEGSSELFVEDKKMQERVERQLASVFFARDLINSPNNEMHPEDFTSIARELAAEFSAEITVFKGEELLENNYPTIHAVGRGSDNDPQLVDMRWGDEKHPKLTIVGKAVCFDTGGYNLKPGGSMRNMKKDMGGGAITLALAKWIMSENLPVRLRVLIPAVENMVSHNAFLPGDIIKTRKGINVEIDNTDAEGRLILCDALSAASDENPDLLLNFATLTGACRVALGPDLPGFFTGSDKLANELYEASTQVKDPAWRLPLWAPYVGFLKSSVADITNSSTSGFAGAITAALYLKEFVKNPEKWVHFDTYCWSDDNKPGTPQGADTQILRAVSRWVENKFKKS